jgi:hypothetical protein
MLWHKLDPLEDDGTPDVLELNCAIRDVEVLRSMLCELYAEVQTLAVDTPADRLAVIRTLPECEVKHMRVELGVRQRLADHLRERRAGPLAVAFNAAAIADLEHGIEVWDG